MRTLGASSIRRYMAWAGHALKCASAMPPLFCLCVSAAGGVQAAPLDHTRALYEGLPIRLAQAPPEVTFWESVRDSENPAEIEAYLKAYPDGVFAPLARIRLEKLKPSAAPTKEEAKSAPQDSEAGPARHTLNVKVGEGSGSKRGVLGVRVSALTEETANGLGLDSKQGAFVTEVLRNSAAELAGLKPLDVIVEFDGRPITDMPTLPRIVGATPPGTETRMKVKRIAPTFAALAARLEASTKKGDADAANSLGWLYATGAGTAKDNAAAARWYRKAADAGLPEAMTRLGLMYANGQGVTKDPTQAVRWYRGAADKNYAGAIAALGTMYELGLGVGKDLAEAARLYRKAADMGHHNAMYSLGSLYAGGLGLPQDDAEAVIWYRRAAEADHAAAIASLGYMYEKGRGVFNDDAQAVRLYRKAVDFGQSGAMHLLAGMYLEGRGVAKDEAAAARLYRRAADLGHSGSMTALGWLHQNGQGVAQDYAEALRLYRKAAQLNHAAAMLQLGLMYANGQGGAKDPAQAVTWYRKAAALGLGDAMYSLGAAYELGTGVAKDPSAAADWVFKAVKARTAFAVKEMTKNADAWSKAFRRELQRRMKDAGVYNGVIDGDFGPSTKTAVEALSKQ